jgi:anaerobic selenocysteine-containing dehydrogenase
MPAHEVPSDQYPLQLITGRTLYHFHTRTKTGRAPQLQDAAPDVWVELSAADADDAGLSEGDLARISTPRGRVEARVRITGIREGVVFLPFHYGYWDTPGGHAPDGAGRAANELTITDWDAASKQPIFKTAAARIEPVSAGTGPSPAPTTTASAPLTDLGVHTTGDRTAMVSEDTDADDGPAPDAGTQPGPEESR